MKIWETHSGIKIIRLVGGRSNVFLVSDKRLKIMVDTSPGRKWPLIQKRLAKLGISAIDFLVLSHTHFDHAANARNINEKYKARIVVHEKELNWLEAGDNIIPRGTNFISKGIIYLLEGVFKSRFRYSGIRADICAGSEFDFSGYGMNALLIHTPGHTPGSMSLIVENEIAITGDTMFGVFPGRVFPPFANDVPAMVNSWEKLLASGCNLYLPSHGRERSGKLLLKEWESLKRKVTR